MQLASNEYASPIGESKGQKGVTAPFTQTQKNAAQMKILDSGMNQNAYKTQDMKAHLANHAEEEN